MHGKFLALLWLFPISLWAAESPTMYPCLIELPEHVLRLSLPEGLVRGSPPKSVREISDTGIRFNASDQFLERDGFTDVLDWLYDFRSSFGFEVRGSLKVHVMVRRRSFDYRGKIGTPEELHRYLSQETDPQYGFAYEQVILNGVECTRRFRNTFGNTVTKENVRELEIFSFPLDEHLFLDVGFNVMEWVPGKTKSWKDRATKLREEIKATVEWSQKGTRLNN